MVEIIGYGGHGMVQEWNKDIIAWKILEWKKAEESVMDGHAVEFGRG